MPVALLSSVGDMAPSLHIANPNARPDVCNIANAHPVGAWHSANAMPRHFLKEWREYAELSQDDLAERVGTTKSVISLLENGHRGLSDKWAYKMADAMNIRAGWIMDFNPNDVPTDVLRTWLDIAQGDRPQALKVLRSFAATGTDGE